MVVQHPYRRHRLSDRLRRHRVVALIIAIVSVVIIVPLIMTMLETMGIVMMIAIVVFFFFFFFFVVVVFFFFFIFFVSTFTGPEVELAIPFGRPGNVPSWVSPGRSRKRPKSARGLLGPKTAPK